VSKQEFETALQRHPEFRWHGRNDVDLADLHATASEIHSRLMAPVRGGSNVWWRLQRLPWEDVVPLSKLIVNVYFGLAMGDLFRESLARNRQRALFVTHPTLYLRTSKRLQENVARLLASPWARGATRILLTDGNHGFTERDALAAMHMIRHSDGGEVDPWEIPDTAEVWFAGGNGEQCLSRTVRSVIDASARGTGRELQLGLFADAIYGRDHGLAGDSPIFLSDRFDRPDDEEAWESAAIQTMEDAIGHTIGENQQWWRVSGVTRSERGDMRLFRSVYQGPDGQTVQFTVYKQQRGD
jgi:hypothetical protein